ncbi:hypothetical protein VMT65_08655 [Nocardia sp. CDC153]|uniref:hypothetical protein n=1 Tax=Nocardia sp. CDC153 TaxID=3112167 RepID=UPI002DB7D7E8|nr:hypothetical protein [Nocardia sp. CDC153]MEC3953097.1 hypothetical protein [Nocardia sp. CDC153]
MRIRAITIFLTAVAVVGPVGCGVSHQDSPSTSAVTGTGGNPPSTVSDPALAPGASDSLSTWEVTLSEFTTLAPAGGRNRFAVSARVRNTAASAGDLSAVHWFAFIQNPDDIGQKATNLIDCPPDLGAGLPRTGSVAAKGIVSGKLCFDTADALHGTAEISVFGRYPRYVAGGTQFQPPDHAAGAQSASPDLRFIIKSIQPEADRTTAIITLSFGTAPSPYWRSQLPTASALDPTTPNSTQECHPGSGMAVTAPYDPTSTPPSQTVTTVELCVLGPLPNLTIGFLPRLYWRFPLTGP